MADDPRLVALLKEYAREESIARPEVGRITGHTTGQLAGVWHRNKDGSWPMINPERRRNRRCQFPIGEPGTKDFHLCGAVRKKGNDLLCAQHTGKKWSCEAVA